MYTQVDNKKTYIYTGGRELDVSKETVVFIHGVGMDHTVWTLPSRHFTRHGRNVLSVDLPGHGRSEGALLTSIPDIGTWITRVLDAVNIERAAIVGHSMGSLIALEAAAQLGERARALVLLGTSAPMPVTGALLSSAENNDHAAIDMLTIWGYSRPAHMGGNTNPGMWMLGGTVRLLERAKPGVIHNDLNACNEYKTGADAATKVTCPTMLILGKLDMMTPPRNSKSISDAIDENTIRLLNGTGHIMTVEQPNQVLDALREMV